MIVGLGIDVAELDRIERALARHGERFLAKVLTEEEIRGLPALARNRAPYVAARFAAKEAASKALGTGFSGGITIKDFGVASDDGGKPLIRFFRKAEDRAMQLGVTRAHLSITHGRDVAAAVVVLEAP
ncbi:holo-[acyl-carrier-protein] synthase [Fundidesulfovibrio agrisoli]|uniref:holo-[acyl-carrier-protein] synthase n=1 Tax=Fundidesulfovibrio agrisoli TaxID=2922717 RepID=UPI001FADDB8C|nr:holo-[acyl-carrier-protein] synthase [Fundidesulfovibrio agrisoli]